MNAKEKFNAIMSLESNSQNMKTEFGYWAGTIKKWLSKGLPQIGKIPDVNDAELIRGSLHLYLGSNELVDKSVMNYFKLDSYLAKFPFDISPMLELEVLEQNNNHIIYRDNYGLTSKKLSKTASVPMVIDYPIKNRKDFYDYKELYDEDFLKRLPPDWDHIVSHLRNREFPIRLGGNPFGFSFLARHLMGEVNFMLTLYDDPILIKELNEFYLDFVMKYWSLILEKVDIDCIVILEDMAYRNGPLFSKEVFNEFLTPYYIKFIDYLRQFKIKNIIVDCDGLINDLIPLWIEVGVTGIFPIEAVNNIVEIREQYPKLQLMGGFNKKVLFEDSNRQKIDEELERLKPIILGGGYIPHIDHAVSEDVTWENFKYYRIKLNNILDQN